METPYPLTKIVGVKHLYILSRTRGWPYIASWTHRITGVMLTLYVLLHILTLSALRNPAYFDDKMKLYASVLPVFFEWLLAVPVIYHALNGGRLILYEIFGNRQDNTILQWVLGLCISYIILLGIFMTMGNQAVSAILFWAYMASASTFVTYLTVTKINRSGASNLWKMQRISGAFLFLMIPAHMLFMHLDPVIGRDAHVIIARMDNIFIKLVDLILVICVLYHGAYGLIVICKDYIPSQRIQAVCTASIVFIMGFFAWLGVKLIVLI
jgi:succinate dehydrogenase / fumarate reductase cytochrome b subunit